MKKQHNFKPLLTAFAFALSLAMFGLPNSIGASMVPTVGGKALAYAPHCLNFQAMYGTSMLTHPCGVPIWQIARCKTYAAAFDAGVGVAAIGGLVALFGGPPGLVLGAKIGGAGTALLATGYYGSKYDGCN